MDTHKHTGRCHCGNIILEANISGSLRDYSPRACDCDFCRKHMSSYVSDPKGTLKIHIADDANVSRYRQGSETASCLVCRVCGVLACIYYEENQRIYATINSKILDDRDDLEQETAVSPKKLSAEERIKRWKELWFSDVSIDVERK